MTRVKSTGWEAKSTLAVYGKAGSRGSGRKERTWKAIIKGVFPASSLTSMSMLASRRSVTSAMRLCRTRLKSFVTISLFVFGSSTEFWTVGHGVRYGVENV